LKRYRIFIKFVAPLISLFFVSCAAVEPLPSFFLLSNASPGRIRSRQSGGTTVFVRRVDIPAYLATGRLVTMKGGIQVDFASTARWAEPLDQGVARAVAENLSRNPRIRAFGFSPGAQQSGQKYDIWIRLERFEGTDDGTVILRGHWAVSSANSSAPIAGRTIDIRRHGWKPGDYPGLVRLLGKEVAEMSQEIARSIP
jgi:uncharacterized lipoprotein YmbA